MLVNNETISKETKNWESLQKESRRIIEANVKESFTQNPEKNSRTGLRHSTSHLATECWTEWHIERIGCRGTSGLCILGNPYILGLCDPTGLINS